MFHPRNPELRVGPDATVLLALPKPAVEQDVHARAQREGYVRKDEFHITIVGRKMAKTIMQNSPDAPDRLQRVAGSLQPNYQLEDELYEIDAPKKDGEFVIARRSLVALGHVAGLKRFIDQASAITGTEITEPFVHATLYTRGGLKSRSGIGIDSADEFGKLNQGKFADHWQRQI